ncbi:MAG: ABC transporter transmembrane domain-containing protein, partial [Alphaproteobacteria bacterium]|nr:ABC transporter transmembrane domain-containing protein [Alphaproteobacteria bacterium]
MLARFFRWLESRTDPLPPEQPEMPPASLIPFMLHYARPFWRLLLASALFSTVIALLEVTLFGFLGRLVDWLASADRATFWDDHGGQIILMGAVVLVVLPILKFFYESISHQGLLGNFAMRTRWQAHRYLLRQSMEFYQDDFAGRVAAKMMQTALAVRDIVMKLTEVLLYVAVYFTAAVVLFASSDLRLTAPMIIWLLGYVAAMRYFVSRLRDLSMAQAEARSVVTGRVVDSYTNIGTVKMFAHAAYEDG